MSSVGDVKPDPAVIGNVAKPPFVQLPDPARIFAKRAERFRTAATAHQLEAGLRFLADLTDLRLHILPNLPEPEMPVSHMIANTSADSIPIEALAERVLVAAALQVHFCRRYAKVLDQQKNPAFDPVATDVASLDLDLLTRESSIRRGSVNPYLLGG